MLVLILIGLITACDAATPPKGLAPGGEIVKKAIALQLSQTQQQLSQQLNASPQKFKITKINVKKIEPLFIGGLATYHLQGTCDRKIQLPHQQVQQKNNHFDIYIQRQQEGKTWRLVKRKNNSLEGETQWITYLIK